MLYHIFIYLFLKKQNEVDAMKYKLISSTLISFLIFGTVFSHAEELVFKDQQELQLNSGLLYRNISQLTESGYTNINILEYDLKSKSTKLDIIYNPDGFKSRMNLSDMAARNPNTLAAVNGDFFSMSQNSFSIGPMIQDGKVISNPHYENEKYATFMMTDENMPILKYLKSDISIENKSTSLMLKVAAINKPTDYYGQITVRTREYSPFSPGADDTFYDLCEVVVIDDVVSEVRKGQPPVEIPENGFVLIAGGNNSLVLENTFSSGDKVNLNYDFDIDIENIETAIGGGSLILKGGEILAPSVKIGGKSQRTAMGIREDKLIFITSDGRYKNYNGMDETDMAHYLKNMGCSEGIMFDGGGSTEMLVKGDIKNTLAGNRERKILNGLSFTNPSPSEKSVSSVEAFLDKDFGYIGESFEITMSVLDRDKNSIKVDPDNLKLESEGVDGSFNENIFIPSSEGSGIIKISYEGSEIKIPISVLKKHSSDPSFVILDDTIEELKKSESEEVSVFDEEKEKEMSLFDDSEGETKEENHEVYENTTLGRKSFKDIFNSGSNICFLRSINPQIDLNESESFFNELNSFDNMKLTLDADSNSMFGYRFDPSDVISFSNLPVAQIDKDTAILNLKTNNGNLYSISGQWDFIKEYLNGDYKNLIFVLDSKQSLSFKQETSFLKEMFNKHSNDKNIYFLYNGSEFSTTREGNTRYISLPPINSFSEKPFFIMNVNGDDISYTMDFFNQ